MHEADVKADRAEHVANGCADACKFLRRHRRGDRPGIDPTRTLRQLHAEKTELTGGADDIGEELVRFFDLFRPRRDDPGGEAPRQVADMLLFLCRLEIRGRTPYGPM
jgi:hypothetical protein